MLLQHGGSLAHATSIQLRCSLCGKHLAHPSLTQWDAQPGLPPSAGGLQLLLALAVCPLGVQLHPLGAKQAEACLPLTHALLGAQLDQLLYVLRLRPGKPGSKR